MQTLVNLATQEKSSMKKPKLLLVSGPMEFKRKADTGIYITQKRLAQIQELQSRLAFERSKLDEEWKTLRKEMMDGAEIELGPIRAWLEYSIRLTKRGACHVTTMFIR